MSFPLSLTFLRGEKTKIGSVEFDAVITFTTINNSEITTHPIELGARISDHVIVEPLEIEIEGVFTNQPLTPPEAIQAGVTSLLSGPLSTNPQARLDALIQLQRGYTLIDVVSPYAVYSDFYINNISAPREAETGDGIVLTIGLQQVLIAQISSNNIFGASPTSPDPNNGNLSQTGQRGKSSRTGASFVASRTGLAQ